MPQNRLENAGFPTWGAEIEAKTKAANAINDYRVRATKLRVLAAQSPDPLIRKYLLTTAAQFDRLADYAATVGSPHAA